MAAEMAAAGGVSVFPGWEFFSAVAGREKSLLSLVPKCALFVDEPAMVRNQIDRWWNKVEQRHDRSGIGSLIQPADIYLRPEILQAQLDSLMGLDLDQLGAVDILDDDNTLGEIELPTRPTLRFHGSIPALAEQLKSLMETESRIVLAAPHQGDVERLATLLREYQVPYRLGSRVRVPAKPARRSQLSGRRSARAGHRALSAGRRRQLCSSKSDCLRRQRSFRRGRCGGAAGAQAIEDRGLCLRLPRSRHSATTWSTSNTASRSIRG